MLEAKNVYYVYNEDHDAEGMFSEDGELLHLWSCNDAHWRHEYFDPFMTAIGINVLEGYHLEDKLQKICDNQWGEWQN